MLSGREEEEISSCGCNQRTPRWAGKDTRGLFGPSVDPDDVKTGLVTGNRYSGYFEVVRWLGSLCVAVGTPRSWC